MTFIVATNVVASQPRERRPTGTPHAHANKFLLSAVKKKRSVVISTLLVPKQEKRSKPLQVCLPQSLKSWKEEKGITKGDGIAERGNICHKTLSEPVNKSPFRSSGNRKAKQYWDKLDKELQKDQLLSHFPKVLLRS